MLVGTNDWEELEFMFDSKNRESVEIAFRLGGNKENTKGTAWFSDIVLEKGIKNASTTWNIVCFIFKNVDVKVNAGGTEKQLKLSMNSNDINTMKDNMYRFSQACKSLSNGKMDVKYNVYEIEDPITSISYSKEFGYYIDPVDVKDKLDKYIEKGEYDHIFAAVRLGDMDKKIEIPVYDWIGLRRDGLV